MSNKNNKSYLDLNKHKSYVQISKHRNSQSYCDLIKKQQIVKQHGSRSTQNQNHARFIDQSKLSFTFFKSNNIKNSIKIANKINLSDQNRLVYDIERQKLSRSLINTTKRFDKSENNKQQAKIAEIQETNQFCHHQQIQIQQNQINSKLQKIQQLQFQQRQLQKTSKYNKQQVEQQKQTLDHPDLRSKQMLDQIHRISTVQMKMLSDQIANMSKQMAINQQNTSRTKKPKQMIVSQIKTNLSNQWKNEQIASPLKLSSNLKQQNKYTMIQTKIGLKDYMKHPIIQPKNSSPYIKHSNNLEKMSQQFLYQYRSNSYNNQKLQTVDILKNSYQQQRETDRNWKEEVKISNDVIKQNNMKLVGQQNAADNRNKLGKYLSQKGRFVGQHFDKKECYISQY